MENISKEEEPLVSIPSEYRGIPTWALPTPLNGRKTRVSIPSEYRGIPTISITKIIDIRSYVSIPSEYRGIPTAAEGIRISAQEIHVSIPSEYRGIPTKDSKVKFIFPTTETSQSPLNIGAFLQNKTSAPVLGARPLSQSPLNIGAFLRHVSH